VKTGRRKPPTGTKQGVAKRKRQSLPGLMPLEPRVMYDAAGAHTAASHLVLDPHHTDTTHAASTTSAPTHAASTASPSPMVTSTHAASSHPQPALVPPSNTTGEIFVQGGNTYAGGSGPTLVLQSASINDPNDQFITEVFVQENNPINGDVLAFNNGPNAGGLAGSGTNKEIFADGTVITFNGSEFLPTNTGSIGIPDLNTALQQLTFQSTLDPTGGGQRSNVQFSFQYVDTQNVASQITTASMAVTAGSPPPPPPPPATPPTVNAGAVVTYAEGGGLVVLDLGLTINGPASTKLDAAKITITNAFSIDQLGFLGGANTQTFGTGDKLTATTAGFNAATGTYTFIITGTGTAAEYQQVLEEVDYGATSGVDPTFGGAHTQRNVTWALSLDGTNFGTASTSTIDVLHNATVDRRALRAA